MHQSIRSLPDLPLASALAAAYGRAVTCAASPAGDHAVLTLSSGACLFVQHFTRDPMPATAKNGLLVRAVAACNQNEVMTLDGLAALRLDLEILQVAGEIVELYVGGQLRAVDFDAALACAEAGADDEEVAEYALQEARRLEHDLGDGEVPAPGACLVELALALRAVLDEATDNAPEVAERSAEVVLRG